MSRSWSRSRPCKIYLGVLVLGSSQKRHGDLWQVVCHLIHILTYNNLDRQSRSGLKLTKYWILPPSNSWGTAVGVSPQNPLEQPAQLGWHITLQYFIPLKAFMTYQSTIWCHHHLSGLSSLMQDPSLLADLLSFPPSPSPPSWSWCQESFHGSLLGHLPGQGSHPDDVLLSET